MSRQDVLSQLPQPRTELLVMLDIVVNERGPLWA